MNDYPNETISDCVEQILGWKPATWTIVRGGYTPAARYVAANDDRSVFVKVATTALTAKKLRHERLAYGTIDTAFRPRLLGWHDDEQPILIIEDLRSAHWPPPWRTEDITEALVKLNALHHSSADLPPYRVLHGAQQSGWEIVARNPAPLLGLGFVSAGWLNLSLPRLLDAEGSCSTDGNAVTHWDIRSDNMCFVDGNLALADWAEACLSNPRLDLGFWLPSLCHEGGPLPEVILPNSPEIAAWVAGFFAVRAGLPEIPDAPNVRRVQREQLATALSWAQRALNMPPP